MHAKPRFLGEVNVPHSEIIKEIFQDCPQNVFTPHVHVVIHLSVNDNTACQV